MDRALSKIIELAVAPCACAPGSALGRPATAFRRRHATSNCFISSWLKSLRLQMPGPNERRQDGNSANAFKGCELGPTSPPARSAQSVGSLLRDATAASTY
eukprot:4264620-Alexandrium_andersonii.AAC.1